MVQSKSEKIIGKDRALIRKLKNSYRKVVGLLPRYDVGSEILS